MNVYFLPGVVRCSVAALFFSTSNYVFSLDAGAQLSPDELVKSMERNVESKTVKMENESVRVIAEQQRPDPMLLIGTSRAPGVVKGNEKVEADELLTPDPLMGSFE